VLFFLFFFSSSSVHPFAALIFSFFLACFCFACAPVPFPSDRRSYHSVSSLSISGTAALDGSLLLNASLHRWPFASDLGRSRPKGKAAADLIQRSDQRRQFDVSVPKVSPSPTAQTAPATAAHATQTARPAPFPVPVPVPFLGRGMGLGGGVPGSLVPGDGSESTAADPPPSPPNATAIANSTAAASNSSASPPPVAGRDSILLLSARGGLVPLHSPAHFSLIQLGALFDVLPPAYTLDLQYVRGSGNGSGHSDSDSAAAQSAPSPLQPESELWLVAFGADYHSQPAAHTTTTSAAAATLLAIDWITLAGRLVALLLALSSASR
jgi:hypothetical protein